MSTANMKAVCDPVSPEGMISASISRLFQVASRLENITERMVDDLEQVSMPIPENGNPKDSYPLSGVGKADDIIMATTRLEKSCDDIIDMLDSLSI